MAKPISISVKEISAAAKGTVSKALKDHEAAFPRPDYRLGYIPPYWWFGIVIYNPLDKGLTLDSAQQLATTVHGGIAASVASAKGGKPGVIFGDGGLTIGFAPSPDIGLIEE